MVKFHETFQPTGTKYAVHENLSYDLTNLLKNAVSVVVKRRPRTGKSWTNVNGFNLTTDETSEYPDESSDLVAQLILDIAWQDAKQHPTARYQAWITKRTSKLPRHTRDLVLINPETEDDENDPEDEDADVEIDPAVLLAKTTGYALKVLKETITDQSKAWRDVVLAEHSRADSAESRCDVLLKELREERKDNRATIDSAIRAMEDMLGGTLPKIFSENMRAMGIVTAATNYEAEVRRRAQDEEHDRRMSRLQDEQDIRAKQERWSDIKDAMKHIPAIGFVVAQAFDKPQIAALFKMFIPKPPDISGEDGDVIDTDEIHPPPDDQPIASQCWVFLRTLDTPPNGKPGQTEAIRGILGPDFERLMFTLRARTDAKARTGILSFLQTMTADIGDKLQAVFTPEQMQMLAVIYQLAAGG